MLDAVEALTVTFRNVDASPADDVRTWPFEAVVTVIERGLAPDWMPLFEEIRRSPWGPVARRVERYLASAQAETDGAATLFRLAIDRARSDRDAADRAVVATRVGNAIASTGISDAAFAEHIGTSASRLSTYRNGRVTPSAAMLVRIEQMAELLAAENRDR